MGGQEWDDGRLVGRGNFADVRREASFDVRDDVGIEPLEPLGPHGSFDVIVKDMCVVDADRLADSRTHGWTTPLESRDLPPFIDLNEPGTVVILHRADRSHFPSRSGLHEPAIDHVSDHETKHDHSHDSLLTAKGHPTNVKGNKKRARCQYSGL